jgi:quercetin 2,3-dioxygenase
MIKIRKSSERGHFEYEWLDTYHSFSFGEYYDPHYRNFSHLRVINEDFIAPHQGFGKHPHKNMEIITYVISGELTHEDSLGTKEVLKAGEFQRMTAGSGIFHSEKNLSDKPVHLFQIWITPHTINF